MSEETENQNNPTPNVDLKSATPVGEHRVYLDQLNYYVVPEELLNFVNQLTRELFKLREENFQLTERLQNILISPHKNN